MFTKPMLSPNEEVNLETLKYPLLASKKLDGIRCIIKNGQILSRSLKNIQNQQIRARLEPLRKFSEDNNCVLDGELYAPNMSFQSITHYVMTEDLGKEELPKDLQFYCFDMITGIGLNEPFELRLDIMIGLMSLFQDIVKIVEQNIVKNKEEIEKLFEDSLSNGCEGLMLRDPKGRYKCGRGTIKEGLIYKVKPFITFDAQIIEVVQSTEVRDGAEKKINELGRSVTSKKKDDRVLIDKASAFMVYYKRLPLKVTLAMTDIEKEEVWKNKEKYIGKYIEYKAMMIGMKDVPRHPVMIRFREDKKS